MDRPLTVLEELKLFELQDAVIRGRRPPEEIPPQDRPYGVQFWLDNCLKYGLGAHPYVREVYQQHYGKPIPQEYEQPNKDST